MLFGSHAVSTMEEERFTASAVKGLASSKEGAALLAQHPETLQGGLARTVYKVGLHTDVPCTQQCQWLPGEQLHIGIIHEGWSREYELSGFCRHRALGGTQQGPHLAAVGCGRPGAPGRLLQGTQLQCHTMPCRAVIRCRNTHREDSETMQLHCWVATVSLRVRSRICLLALVMTA